MFGIDNFPAILEYLVKIGVNVTEKQLILLKWRLSPEGQKYYTEQENVEFYEALSKGDTEVIDLIQNKKQEIIDDLLLLKQTLLSLSIIGLCFSLVSCSTPGLPQRLDESSIKEKERTYQLENQQVKTEDGIKEVDNGWYIVHKDFINIFNENQDNLIKSLQYIKDSKETTNKLEKKINILYGVSGCSVLIILIGLIVSILVFFLRKK